MAGGVADDRKIEGPGPQQWHDKDPSSKTAGAEHRPTFCSPSVATVCHRHTNKKIFIRNNRREQLDKYNKVWKVGKLTQTNQLNTNSE